MWADKSLKNNQFSFDILDKIILSKHHAFLF